MNRIATSALPSILFASLLVVPAAQASLMNGDFSSGFDGWQGEVADVSVHVTRADPLPGGSPDNFDASSGAAVLQTSSLADDIFSVSIFQTFTVDPAGRQRAEASLVAKRVSRIRRAARGEGPNGPTSNVPRTASMRG